jgi:GntR family transcriptional repressor for pyruvate dehydrogenase complex
VSVTDAVLRPVRDGNAFESTVDALGTAIRLGVFGPGERLPSERDLAERLRVGRATLREAIGALREAGLVATSRGRSGGTVVLDAVPRPAATRRSPAEIADLLAFRRVVEPGAAQLAASADLSAGQRAELSSVLEAVRAAGGHAARRVADARLHLAVASLSGSTMVVDAVTQAQAGLSELLAAIPVLRPNIEHSDVQHAEMVAAVLQGDVERARQVMEEHCDATSALLRGLLG